MEKDDCNVVVLKVHGSMVLIFSEYEPAGPFFFFFFFFLLMHGYGETSSWEFGIGTVGVHGIVGSTCSV
jgi:hypothetical protein